MGMKTIEVLGRMEAEGRKKCKEKSFSLCNNKNNLLLKYCLFIVIKSNFKSLSQTSLVTQL